MADVQLGVKELDHPLVPDGAAKDATTFCLFIMVAHD